MIIVRYESFVGELRKSKRQQWVEVEISPSKNWTDDDRAMVHLLPLLLAHLLLFVGHLSRSPLSSGATKPKTCFLNSKYFYFIYFTTKH